MRSSDQSLHVERPRIHREAAGSVFRPLTLRPVPVQFESVAVGIPQVERLAHSVVGRTVQRHTVLDQPSQRIGQVGYRKAA